MSPPACPCLLRLVTVFMTAIAAVFAPQVADAEGSATDLDHVMGGTWEFTMVGTTPGMSQSPKDYNRTSRIHFIKGRFDKNPLGFESSDGFRLRAFEPDGSAVFDSPYSLGGGQYPMTFKGALSHDGNQLTGSFDFCMASGTFTAVREAVLPDRSSLSVPVGEVAKLRLRLTLKPDGEVTVRASRLRGDKQLKVATPSLIFTPENWDQSQVMDIDAGTVTRTGNAMILISGNGLPDCVVPTKIVHAATQR